MVEIYNVIAIEAVTISFGLVIVRITVVPIKMGNHGDVLLLITGT
jgi:hypothetical protein